MPIKSNGFVFFIGHPSLLILYIAAQSLKLNKADGSNDQRQNYAHGVCITIFKPFKGRFIEVIHNRRCPVIRTAGGQQLNQRKALERINRRDNNNVQCGR